MYNVRKYGGFCTIAQNIREHLTKKPNINLFTLLYVHDILKTVMGTEMVPIGFETEDNSIDK